MCMALGKLELSGRRYFQEGGKRCARIEQAMYRNDSRKMRKWSRNVPAKAARWAAVASEYQNRVREKASAFREAIRATIVPREGGQ